MSSAQPSVKNPDSLPILSETPGAGAYALVRKSGQTYRVPVGNLTGEPNQVSLKLSAANPTYTGTLTGGTGTINIGSGQIAKDVDGNVSLSGLVSIGGTSTNGYKFSVQGASGYKRLGSTSDATTTYHYSDGAYYAGTTASASYALVTSNLVRQVVSADGITTFVSAPFGYGVGAGGTVTQVTSKGQPVVMASPKPSGRITMHNASLAAGASVEFGFTNACLGGSDGIVVRPDGFSGYSVEPAYFNSATEVVLRVTNKGATRSDALGIVFQIIKGSTT